MLAYTNLTAPFAGVITQKNIDAGSMANPGMPILMMEQPGNYQVNASVSEADIANIKEGADAQVVDQVNRKSNKRKNLRSKSIVTIQRRTVHDKSEYLRTREGGLYSGMYVNVTIPVTK